MFGKRLMWAATAFVAMCAPPAAAEMTVLTEAASSRTVVIPLGVTTHFSGPEPEAVNEDTGETANAPGETTPPGETDEPADLPEPPPLQPESPTFGHEEPWLREALTLYYSGNRASLAQLAERLADEERAARTGEKLQPSDAVRYLHNNTLADRNEFLAAQETAARTTRDKSLQMRIAMAVLTDEYHEMNQLKGQERFNRFTRVFNRASGAATKAAFFQPQDAAQLVLDAAYSFRKARAASERERRILFLTKQFLEKYPDAPEAGEVRELQRQLREKILRDWAESEKTAGDTAFKRGNHWAAEFHLENSHLLQANSATSRSLTEARDARALARWNHETAAGMSSIEVLLMPDEREILARAARALIAGRPSDVHALRAAAPALTDSIDYAVIALLEKTGQHDDALARTAALAKVAPDSAGGRAAAGLLRTEHFHLGESFDRAVADLRDRQKRFMLTGARTTDDTAYAASSAAVQSAGGAASGVPFLFFTDMLVRGVAEKFRTQMETDSVIDAGARYMRKYPASARTPEIARQLAILKGQANDYDAARDYLRTAGAEEGSRELRRTDENEARRMVNAAKASDDLPRRKQLLVYVVKNLDGTKIAATARKELDKLPPTLEQDSIVLTPAMLKEDPELVSLLGIEPAWVDGRRSNREMAPEGLAFDGDGGRYSFRERNGTEFLMGELPKDWREHVLARARALRELSDYGAAGKSILQKRILPLSVVGGAGGSGVSVSPRLIPYRSGGADSRLYR